MNLLKRSTALVLMTVMLFGLVSGIPNFQTVSAQVDVDGNEVVNLLDGKNPSFEEYSIPNWEISDCVSQSSQQTYAGSQWSLKMVDRDANTSCWAINDKYAVAAGESYIMSAYVYGGIGQLSALFYDVNGNLLLNEIVTIATQAPANEWQKLEQEIVIPENATHISLKISTTNEGTQDVFFDVVSLGVAPEPPFVPEFPNGDFEAEWTGSQPPYWINKGSGGTVFEKVSGKEGSGFSVTKASGAGYTFTSDRVAIRGGLTYTFTIDVNAKPSTGGCQLYMYFYEDATTKTKLKTCYWIAMGDFSDGWHTLSVNGIAPENANYVEILITDPRYSVGAACFDNAILKIEDGLVNPSFEGPVVSQYSVSSGWDRVESSGASINTDPTYVRSGSQSICLERYLAPRCFYIQVKPGEEYEATVYVKRQAGQTDAGRASIYIYFYDANGNRRNGPMASVVPVDDEWTKLTITASAIDGEVAANFLFTPDTGSGLNYFDDASFTQLTNYNMVKNLLSNGGFETKALVGTSPMNHWTPRYDYDSPRLAVEYIDAERGFAGRVFNGSYVPFYSEPIAVTPGEKYSLTLNATGTGRVQAIVYFYANEFDDPLGYMCDSTGTALAKFNTTSNLKKDTWTQLAVSGVEIPEGANYIRIWLIGMYDNITNELDLYMDDVWFFKGLPQLVIPGKLDTVSNPSFEELDKAGNPVDWGTVNNKVFSIVDAADSPKDVFDGRYALKLTVPPELYGTHGVTSEMFPVTAGTTYQLSLYAKEGQYGGDPFQLYICFYDNKGNRLAAFFNNTTTTGEWNYCDVSGAAPGGTVYAKIQLVSGSGKGYCLFDAIKFESMGANAYDPVEFDIDWQIADSNHPRLYFNQKGLEKIQKFSKSKGTSAYGYAGTVALKSLLKEADQFLAETSFGITYPGGVRKDYPLYPVFEDPTCREDFKEAPPGFNVVGYPYMTQLALQFKTRMQTLTLAYAITGEKAYGERAAQYALDICNWKYWSGEQEMIGNQNSGLLSAQSSGDITDCVAMAYDMCYDLFTEAEREKIRTKTIELGLEPMYEDCWPRMLRGRDMDHATCMISAACSIMTEDNIDELSKYLNMGMSYITWRLDQFEYSGVNEGHSYDSLAIDDIVVTMDIMERCTGYAGPWDHPFIEGLDDIVLGFFDPVNGQLPAYSDCSFGSYYPYSMAVFSQRGNMLATYYLSMSNALSTPFDQLVYFTTETMDTLEPPFDNERNVGYIASKGFGALRTGFGALDSLLVLNANNSQQEHNHFDQNSILLAFNGVWMLSDTGYKDQSGSDLTTYQMKYTNSTIFVDGKPQVRKGQGTMELVFDNTLYGYIIGSAPGAYGMEDLQQVLNKFDRHTIMINHDSQPYYLIIDDLESNKERNFGWNFYTNGWDRLEVDGQLVEKGESGTGNRITISRFGSTLRSYFVSKDPITTKEVTFNGLGPTLLVESEATKSYQFMNVLSLQKGSGSQIGTLFEHMMKSTSSTELVNNKEGEICWETRKGDISSNAVLSVSIGGPLVMFRAGLPGDWITFPFTVEQTKEYGVSIEVGRSTGYSGTWNLYLDGELVKTFEPNGPVSVLTFDIGKRTLEAGEHELKAVLASTTETIYNGTIMSVGSILLDTGESMGEGIVQVTDTYDTDDVLGAAISYGTVLSDVVLFNRGTGLVSAGKLTTDGKQASVLGLYNDVINEGYAATDATSLMYGDLVLMTANGPASVAVDYTFAKMPIKNTADEKEIELHEDFDINNPVIKVSTALDEAREITILVGVDYPYTATLNGETLESSYKDGMLTMTVPAGTNKIEILGVHQCVFDQMSTHIQNIKTWANCDHANIYYVSCVCGKNGTESFTVGEAKDHKIVAVKAKEATDFEDGCIAHFACKNCDKLFADAEGEMELKLSDVIISKLTPETPANDLTWVVWICLGGAVIATGAIVFILLRKKNNKGK